MSQKQEYTNLDVKIDLPSNFLNQNTKNNYEKLDNLKRWLTHFVKAF